MEVIINGQWEKILKDQNLSEMLDEKNYKDRPFAVAVNGKVISRQKYEEFNLSEGDEVEIVEPFPGG